MDSNLKTNNPALIIEKSIIVNSQICEIKYDHEYWIAYRLQKKSVRVLSKQFNEIKKRFIYPDGLHNYSNNVTHVIPIWYSKHKKQIWQKWWSIDLWKSIFFFPLYKSLMSKTSGKIVIQNYRKNLRAGTKEICQIATTNLPN